MGLKRTRRDSNYNSRADGTPPAADAGSICVRKSAGRTVHSCHGTVSTVSTQHGAWGSEQTVASMPFMLECLCQNWDALAARRPAPLASPPFPSRCACYEAPPCPANASLHSCDGAILPIWLWRKQRPKDHRGQAWRALASGRVLASRRRRCYYQSCVKVVH